MRLKVPFWGYALAGIAFALPTVVLAAVLPYLINTQPIRAKLLREIGVWTGAEVKVAGSISIESMFSLSVEAQNVEVGQFKTIEPVKGMRAERVVARIAWFNLLFGNFEFDKIKIYGAVFKVTANRTPENVALFSDLISAPRGNAFAAFHVDDSLIAFRQGSRKPFQRLLVKSALVKTGKSERRLSTSARLVWKGKPLELSLRTAFRSAPGALIPLRLRVASELLSGGFDGEVTLTGPRNAEGDMSLLSPASAKAADWLGIAFDPGALGESLSARGRLAVTDDLASLRSGEISVAGQTAQAALTLLFTKPLPRLEGALAFNALDLQALLSGQGRGAGMDRSPSLATLLETDLRVSAKAVTWGGLQTSSAALTLTSRPERLSAEIAQLVVFGGDMRGQIAITTAGPTTHASARLSAEAVDAAKLLSLAHQRDWLSGAANANVEAEALWNDPRQITEKVVARARVHFPDGGQMRLDIPRLAKSGAGETNGWGAFDFTGAAFETLRFEAALRDGQISFSNVDLAAAGGNVNGRGQIDLAARSLDWRFTVGPSGAPPRGGPYSGSNVHAPTGSAISITGPWTRPIIRSGGASRSMIINARGRSVAALEVLPYGR